MLSQLVNGLAVCGVLESVKSNPIQMKDLCCKTDSAECQLDNSVFIDLTEAQFRHEQQRKALEIDTPHM